MEEVNLWAAALIGIVTGIALGFGLSYIEWKTRKK